ncbi:MAG: TonB-dependent receptor [Oceanicaulis sp.]|nr:TonB-dependent receptor [Oceanicaulis sp.]
MAKRFTGRSLRAWAMAGAAGAALVLGGVGHAQGSLPSEPVRYDIRTGSLAEALEIYAIQTDLELFSPSELLRGRSATPLRGDYSPAEALELLLQGTSLTWRINEHGTLIIGEGGGLQPISNVSGSSQASRTSGSHGAAAGAQQRVDAGGMQELAAGNGVITGRVTDAQSGAPLPGAIVRIGGSNRSSSADARGFYRLPSLPAGEHELEVDYIGASLYRRTVTLARQGQITEDFSISTTTDVITVQGYRSSLARALSQQRAAANASTIVSADLLGSFPAGTVSESLRRLPGVAFTRDDDTGEGSGITVRGFGSEAINIQLNGLDLQGTGFTRSIDLSGVLAGNISQVTIQKSLLPSMESTGSGGLVQIETRSGLDYDETTFSIGAQRTQGFDSYFGGQNQINATAAYQFTPTFGVVGVIQYRETDQNNIDAAWLNTTPPVLPAGFTNVILIPSSNSFPFDPEFDEALLRGATYQFRDRNESNLTASLNFAWDIADHTRLRLDVQHIRREATNTAARAQLGFTVTGQPAPIAELGGEERQRFFLNNFQRNLGLTSSDISTEISSISLRGETDIGSWGFRYGAGTTRTVSRSENINLTLTGVVQSDLANIIDPDTIQLAPNSQGVQRVIDGGMLVVGDNLPVLSLSAEGMQRLFDAEAQEVTIASRARSNDPTEAYTLNASAQYNFGSGLFDYLKVGGKYDRSERSSLFDTFPTSAAALPTSESYIRVAGQGARLTELGIGSLNSQDLSVVGGGGRSVPSIDLEMARAIFDALPALAAGGRYNFTDRSALDPIMDSGASRPSRTVEETFAGYVEGLIRIGRLELAGGVRYERKDRVGRTITLPSFTTEDGALPREVMINAGLVTFQDTGGVQDTWTPSALATWRHNDQLVARLGYFRSTINPDFRLIRRGTQYFVNLTTTTPLAILREANPDLQPSVTDNFDLDIAYYFRDTPGLVRLAFFYKDISNNFTSVLLADEPADVRQRVLDFFAPLEEFQPGITNLPDDTEFRLNRPQNGEGGYTWGVEAEVIRQLDFLPGFLSDFGVLLNLTYTDGSFPTLVNGRNDDSQLVTISLDRPLANQARWAGTASLNYERGPFSGRVIYTYQSVTVNSYSPLDLNTITPEFSTLDFRADYSLERWGGRFNLYLQGNDLLRGPRDADIRSATASTYGQSDADFFFPGTVQYRGGRTIMAGVRATF